jgi:hypothetical protein
MSGADVARYVIDARTLLHIVDVLRDRVSRRTARKIARTNGWDTTFDAEYLAVCQLQLVAA